MNDASLPADHSCLAHPAAPTVGVIADTAVKQAAVIPDDGLPRFPRVTKYLLGFGCVFQQHVEQFAALGSGHPNDRSRMRACLLYTSPSPRDGLLSRMPSSA